MARRRQISARSNAQLVRIRRLLADPAAYRRLGMAWVEGEHPLQAALARGHRVDEVFVDAAREHEAAIAALVAAAERVTVVETRLWREVSGMPSPPAVGALLQPPAGAVRPREATVVLDRVQDAGNVGSILRSAAAFGFAQVLAIEGTAGLWSPKVLRASMGAHFALRLVEGLSADDLQALRVPLLAASSHAQRALSVAALPYPCAWVFGHEGQGIDAGLAARCMLTLRIPQPGGEESLNVAAAAAVCLYASTLC
jgi:TrmH family RNA methyltransferase